MARGTHGSRTFTNTATNKLLVGATCAVHTPMPGLLAEGQQGKANKTQEDCWRLIEAEAHRNCMP